MIALREGLHCEHFQDNYRGFLHEMKARPVRREQTTLPNVIASNGGVPIQVGKDVIGGLGLSSSRRAQKSSDCSMRYRAAF
jgi:uncharacterized protein GlcG (DUF336 family)